MQSVRSHRACRALGGASVMDLADHGKELAFLVFNFLFGDNFKITGTLYDWYKRCLHTLAANSPADL